MVIFSSSDFTSSSASSLSGEQTDLQSCLREAEAFIQENFPRNAPGSLAEAPPFSINLGSGGMALPAMRAPSTGNAITLDMLPAANSGKSVDQLVGLGDGKPTFGGMSASDFTDRVASGEITEGDRLMDYRGHHQDEYPRNIASLGGEMLTDTSVLAGSSNNFDGDTIRPNLRDRKTIFAPNWYNSPVSVKPECVVKAVVSSALVKLHLVSLNDIGNVICGGEIGTGQNLRACVALVARGLTTCDVRSRSTKVKGFDESTVYITTPLVWGKVTVYLTPVLKVSSISSTILQSLLQLERTVSFWTSLLPRISFLPAADLNNLISTLDAAVAVPPNHFTPQKSKSTAASRALDSISFLDNPLVQADDVLAVSSSDPDTLFPLLCSRIEMLHLSFEKLRTGLVDCQTILADSFQSLGIKVELLRDHLGSDPRLTDVHLRSVWEGIA